MAVDELVDHITPDVRAVIGARSDWLEAPHPVEASEVRRFFQALMDPNPRFWDTEHAAGTRYGAVVAPPGFPVHAFRRPADDSTDSLAAAGDPDFDGVSRAMRVGLPKLPIALSGILNGGYEYEFFSYPKVGDRIQCRSAYLDIYQKQGKAGPMVLVVIEDEYRTADGRPLLKSLNTMIMR
ncbi:MaoC dehydratase-like protein [Ancylobacter aquaticus]|uniref:MaoC dehydratase-like protein n=1 Tax=Ancylobacter aquaticus TaxID=100 RepID=A0A4R1I6N9_ANCAQ|nr:MaoC family dehydratase N-terminal domain-containing protein [Ancylobacter aquaticus]TCK28349.1 MaoC dehydratase-like protein [Ancylobacter aquaticus]